MSYSSLLIIKLRQNLFCLKNLKCKFCLLYTSLEGAELHLNRLRKDIYEDGSGVDTQQDEMRDISGEALKFKYID